MAKVLKDSFAYPTNKSDVDIHTSQEEIRARFLTPEAQQLIDMETTYSDAGLKKLRAFPPFYDSTVFVFHFHCVSHELHDDIVSITVTFLSNKQKLCRYQNRGYTRAISDTRGKEIY